MRERDEMTRVGLLVRSLSGSAERGSSGRRSAWAERAQEVMATAQGLSQMDKSQDQLTGED